MKLLTLNTHSWMEENPLEKLTALCDGIVKNEFDVIALQEVNQTISEEMVDSSMLVHYVAAEERPVIKKDNFALQLQKRLLEKGLNYHWTWVPSHVGYDRYDEGVALLSRKPIQQTATFFASQATDFEDYKTRNVLGIQTEGAWFFSLHLGWWEDSDPFNNQWQRCESFFNTLNGPIFLMGDFNNPAHQSGEGYDLVTQKWVDTYKLAEKKDSGFTVKEEIDGWVGNLEGLRIDYIFSNKAMAVRSSEVIFNGKNEPVVSDHFGVAVEINLQ